MVSVICKLSLDDDVDNSVRYHTRYDVAPPLLWDHCHFVML